MNIDDVLLNPKELCEHCENAEQCIYDAPHCRELLFAQAFKLLEWLKDNEMITHDKVWWVTNRPHRECKLCELESKLKEG